MAERPWRFPTLAYRAICSALAASAGDLTAAARCREALAIHHRQRVTVDYAAGDADVATATAMTGDAGTAETR
ncbi:hypothetical protein ACQP0C_41960 (plasmid) [Nocardia sp. CA-129566]|uniref:hypothetical protein n=1 Tax=Nocardia sp. CA-129566 TaxID=3239976 RepID=UPI003D9901E3